MTFYSVKPAYIADTKPLNAVTTNKSVSNNLTKLKKTHVQSKYCHMPQISDRVYIDMEVIYTKKYNE